MKTHKASDFRSPREDELGVVQREGRSIGIVVKAMDFVNSRLLACEI